MPRSRRSGFAGERIRVLPQSIAESAMERPVTAQLLVTDCGYFPHAADHRRSRPNGAAQAIVIVCTEGAGWCELGGARYRVAPGEALVIPSRTPHVYGSDPSSPWSIWWLHVTGDASATLVDAAVAERGPVRPVPELAKAVALVEETVAALEVDESPASLMAASGAAWHLLALLASGQRRPRHDRSSPLARALTVLQQDLARRVPVTELAGLVGLSPSHLSALFRREVGCGPGEYHMRLRMSAARNQLDTTDLPVSAIARHVGFTDQFHFARQFRALHGMTATQYRDRDKG